MSDWKDIRARRVAAEPQLDDRIADERRALEVVQRLAAARDARRVTQSGLAARMGVSQPNVSRIEREADIRLSTLHRYVEALGGRLQIAAVFEDGTTASLLDEQPDASRPRRR
ncbi:MAG TPA: helix-turn-helix domain-containing protein [Solirubrobacteraceae bacterium]|jgi:transcriptional regulator with XRE-family HTH domain|nr:helix-turn-helix domain-containing protein [Solirubrobacteraceae bacterium]